MIFIDGAEGEGGGQVLRSALSLSLATGKPFKIERIRAKRPKPGLLRQHLTAVRAAAEIGGAKASGAELCSQELVFEPTKIEGGAKSFAIGSAGSACLVVQTALPGLMAAKGSSTLSVEGGTHNQNAPCFEFLERAFLPVLNKAGAKLEIKLESHGFYPAGGGRIVLKAEPGRCGKIEMSERGALKQIRLKALGSKIPQSIVFEELEIAKRALAAHGAEIVCEAAIVESNGPGNAFMAELDFECCAELATAFGERGVSREDVARELVRQVEELIASEACVGEHLADQLLLPMALGAGGSFTCGEPSSHTRTNIEVIKKFMDAEIICERLRDGLWAVKVET